MTTGGTTFATEPVSAPYERSASQTPVALGALLALGVLVSSAGLTRFVSALAAPGLSQTPLHGIRLAAAVAPLAALAMALLILQLKAAAWPWLLLLGTLLALPQALINSAIDVVNLQSLLAPDALWVMTSLGPPLVLVAVLAAAQHCARAGRIGSCAAVTGAALAAPWLGAALGAYLQPQPAPLSRWVHLALGTAAVLGALLALLAASTRRAQQPRVVTSVRSTIAGLLVVMVMLAVSLLTLHQVSVLMGVSYPSLQRREYAVVGIVGVVLLAGGLVAAAIAGLRPLVAVVLMGLVCVGCVTPMKLGLAAGSTHAQALLIAAAAGFVVGLLLALSRWRALLAAGLAFVLGAAAIAAVAATGGELDKVVTHRLWLHGSLLVAGTVAVVVAAASATAVMLAMRGSLPAVFGPIGATVVLGGNGALTLTQLTDGQPATSVLGDAMQLSSSAGLLVLATIALVGVGTVGALRRPRISQYEYEDEEVWDE